MAGRRLLYLAILASCVIFYIAYGQWLAWLVLVTALAAPWFSLVLSLPAIITFRVSASVPRFLEPGMAENLWLVGGCSLPMPPFRGRLKLKRLITGESWYYQDREDLVSDHCGGIQVTPEAVKVFDYLGLFSFPVRCREKYIVLIRPRPVPMEQVQDTRQQLVRSWIPKSGGGYAENHELRPYRPGDSLNQVHWKLSAKTGGLIIREAMEPRQGLVLLTMNLRGTPEALDRKFGRLLWLGEHLLEQNIRFELRVLTGEGLLTFSIPARQQLKRAIDSLLCKKAAVEGDLRQRDTVASWHCHIGGEPDEA